MPKGSKEYYSTRPEQYDKLKKQSVINKQKTRESLYRIVNAYKKNKGCADCKEVNPLFLDFDHDNPSDKIDTIAHLISRGRKLDAIAKELSKCTVRCVKCHRIRTAKQFSWYTEIATLAELEDALGLELSSD